MIRRSDNRIQSPSLWSPFSRSACVSSNGRTSQRARGRPPPRIAPPALSLFFSLSFFFFSFLFLPASLSSFSLLLLSSHALHEPLPGLRLPCLRPQLAVP